MDKLTKLIKEWSKDRGLDKSDPSKQFLKVVEELGELSEAIAKDDVNGQVDGIGDVYVTLVILAQQLHLDIEGCVRYAYNEIADRKGKMINGVFVKEEDL